MDLSIASMLNQVIPFFNPHLIRARVAVRNMHSKLLSSSKMITATTLGFLFTLFSVLIVRAIEKRKSRVEHV